MQSYIKVNILHPWSLMGYLKIGKRKRSSNF